MAVKTDARLKILFAAERLFAERGIDNVSLREIAASAGQRNNSAVQYHFGTKEGLIRALYEHRLAPLNRRRLDLLAAIRSEGLESDLHALVTAYVRPLADAVRRARGTSWYARFVNRYVAAGRGPAEPFGAEHVSGVFEILRRIEGCLSGLPAMLREERLRTMQLLITSVVADLERRHEQESISEQRAELVLSDLIETTVALLTSGGSDNHDGASDAHPPD